MQEDPPLDKRRYYSHPYKKRSRTPRFGLIILIILAILSIVIALTFLSLYT